LSQKVAFIELWWHKDKSFNGVLWEIASQAKTDSICMKEI